MGKGGGKQHTPYEAPNDLTSRQKLSVIDLVSEGPIEGPVDDLKGVYLNNTPVIDSSGNSNVNGMTAQWVSGTLEQPALEGFSSSSSETPVGIEIKKNTPVTRTITSRNIDRLRLTFGTQALVEIKDNGDRVGTSVELQVQIQRNGQWVTEKNVTIRGKRSNSPYLMAVVIDNLPPPPFSIRMVRITADSTSDSLQNNTMWSSYTEITDINQTYPGSAVAGLTFESEQFGNQYPTRNYLVRGLIVQVPNNYDPETRTYRGIWDGTFKPAYTNNPAWVLYCLLTATRFGLGKRLKVSEVDKFALYVIGQYCDQLVPDGFGNKEPRVTCNAYITDIRKAYDYFSDLCSMMRVMPVWNGQQMTFIQDRPSDVVWPYTNANIVSGRFNYSFSPLKARHTVIEVRFIDPQNGWKTSVEQVSDDALIAQFGLNVLKVDAFGCTSRGQARRHGLWILLTEKLETQTVEFDIGAEGLRHTPGDIIEIMDNDWVGGEDPVGGRLIAIDAAQKVLTLDREVTKPKSGAAFITLMNGTGRHERVKVTGYLANNQIKVDSMPRGIEPKTVWGITKPDLARRLFRAITISDKGDGTYGIIAVQHIPEKEAIVDQGVKFEPLPDTPLGGYIPPIANLSVEVSPDSDNWQVEANWTTMTAVRGVDFILKLTQAGRIVGSAKTEENRYRMGHLPQGNYLLSVAPQNKDGQKGDQASISFDINPPPPPSYIDVEPGFFSLGIIPHVSGQNALRLQYEFWFSEKQIANINEVEYLAEYLGNGTMWVIQGRKLKANQTYYVYVRTINPVGKSYFVEASGKPEDKSDEIVDFLGDKFLSTEAGEEMQKDIDFSRDKVDALEIEQQETSQKVIDIDSKTVELDNRVVQINTDVGIANEAILQNTLFTTQLSYKISEEKADRKAEIIELKQVQVTDREAAARWQTQTSAVIASNTSSILAVQEAQATYEEASAKQINQVKADVEGVTGRVTEVESATATLTEAQAKFERSTVAQFEEHMGYITRIETTVSNDLFSLSESVMQTAAQFASQSDKQLKSEARITKNEKAVATETEARAVMGVQIDARLNDTESAITDIKEVQSEQDKALAKTTEQLRAEIKIGDDKLQENIDEKGRELSKVSSSIDEQKIAIAELDKTQTEIKQTQQSQYKDTQASIADLKQTQASDNAVLSESILQNTASINQQGAELTKTNAEVKRISTATANNEKSTAALAESVKTQFEDSEAAIVDVRKSVAEVDKAQSERTEQVRAELGKGITDNKGEIDKTKGDLANVSAAVTSNAKAIAATDKTLTEKTEQAASRFEDNEASISNIQQSQSNIESSQAETSMQITAQQNKLNSELLHAKASITETNKVVADNHQAFVQKGVQLDAQFENVNSRLVRVDTAIADNEKALTQTQEQLRAEFKSDFDDTNSLINENKSAIAETNKSIVKVDRDLNARVGKAEGSIGETQKAVADNERALADFSQLTKAEFDNQQAAIEQRAQTVFDHQGNGSAIYKIQAGIHWNGQYHDAKFIIGAEVKNGQVTTQIGFSADTFGILNPSSGKLEPVFFVENGQVFINEAFINQATIEKLLIGSTIKSKNWDPIVKKGLMLDFEKGKLIANDAEITGIIYARDGEFNGTVYVDKLIGDNATATVYKQITKNEVHGKTYDQIIESSVIYVGGMPYDVDLLMPTMQFESMGSFPGAIVDAYVLIIIDGVTYTPQTTIAKGDKNWSLICSSYVTIPASKKDVKITVRYITYHQGGCYTKIHPAMIMACKHNSSSFK
ncbi:phage tail protein [Moellerella wisconsensis]|uniref:TipJ family phage tail tip protein n=3 Tax=Moellerella wisconsensis TaxID=158849 RepID=UPI0025B210CC|nr:phage tail protein [Moellerella wisconsensis]WJW81019.1 phage tail protein [Moellerella wisconsensis]